MNLTINKWSVMDVSSWNEKPEQCSFLYGDIVEQSDPFPGSMHSETDPETGNLNHIEAKVNVYL